MKHLFIINPAAGGKKSRARQTEQDIQALMHDKDLNYEIYITKAPMDACDKIRQVAQSSEELRVYACGGDGTLNECVNGAAGMDHVAVAHYPCGTGNDFVKLFGREDEERFRDFGALMDGFTRPIDIIDCNGRLGIDICSVGIDARIGSDVHKYSALPLIGGAMGYVVSLVVNLIRGVTQTLTITTENSTLDGRFTLLCACNGRFYGGGFNPVPTAQPDDGLLDFLIVNAVSRLKFLMIVGKYAKGRHEELPGIITHIRGKTMRVESPDEIVVNIDGEMIRTKIVSFKLIDHGVRILFPSGLRFFDLREAQYSDISSKQVI